MGNAAAMSGRRSTPAEILVRPYRLFFLGAAGYVVIHMLLWLCFLSGGPIAASGNPFAWHGYELIFGFAGAIVTGFLLTAAGNWTGRRTVSPTVLIGLIAAWLGARIAHAGGADATITLVGDGIVLWGLVIALGRVLILAGNRRNYRLLPIVGLLALGATVFQLAALEMIPDWRYPVLHVGIELLALLMVIMGGRVVPFFTSRRLPDLPVENPEWLGNATAIFVLAAIIGGWVLPASLAAALAWFAGCLLLARLLHWSPLGTLREPMLWILHVGYLWLALALFLRGGALAWDWMPLSTAMHAIGMGALGCLGLGMMTRVALGHGGHAMRAPLWLVPAFVLVSLAPIARLLAAHPGPLDPRLLYALGGGAWVVAFGIYVVGFLPILLGPRAEVQ